MIFCQSNYCSWDSWWGNIVWRKIGNVKRTSSPKSQQFPKFLNLVISGSLPPAFTEHLSKYTSVASDCVNFFPQWPKGQKVPAHQPPKTQPGLIISWEMARKGMLQCAIIIGCIVRQAWQAVLRQSRDSLLYVGWECLVYAIQVVTFVEKSTLLLCTIKKISPIQRFLCPCRTSKQQGCSSLVQRKALRTSTHHLVHGRWRSM